ncbi:hypothetical protein ANN_08193 [Periplaneta americana]|uniref:Endonuclease-reverse transcriptase n=1 Tax=Periplaneta americana TaxID=6978 RepID=A0ABQ8T2A1_PERAM|nr:hypothetical protein ANN_08193 [Periplaneta americana]
MFHFTQYPQHPHPRTDSGAGNPTKDGDSLDSEKSVQQTWCRDSPTYVICFCELHMILGSRGAFYSGLRQIRELVALSDRCHRSEEAVNNRETPTNLYAVNESIRWYQESESHTYKNAVLRTSSIVYNKEVDTVSLRLWCKPSSPPQKRKRKLLDSATYHISSESMIYINIIFVDGLISKELWLSQRSPDLTLVDYFLWDQLKERNDTREEIKRRINMGNACYSVEKLLSSSLLSKNLKVRIYKTVILPVLLYGCETWTLTLREEHRLRVFENKVLRKIFGAKRDEVTGEWRKLQNTELHALYCSPDIIRNIKSRRLRWAGHVARMGESRNAYRVLVGRPEGKRPLERPRRRWEDIKMYLREVGYDDRDWINLAQDRDRWRAYVRAAMNLRSRLRAAADFGLPGMWSLVAGGSAMYRGFSPGFMVARGTAMRRTRKAQKDRTRILNAAKIKVKHKLLYPSWNKKWFILEEENEIKYQKEKVVRKNIKKEGRELEKRRRKDQKKKKKKKKNKERRTSSIRIKGRRRVAEEKEKKY